MVDDGVLFTCNWRRNENFTETEARCGVCKEGLDAVRVTRVLTRATYEHYGIHPAESVEEVRICQKCRLGCLHLHADSALVFPASDDTEAFEP